MVVTPLTTVGTASAVLALSKAAWKLGSSLSKLDQDTKTVDATVKNLAEETRSLSNECDLVYAELEEVVRRGETGSPPLDDVDGRMWKCLEMQVEEISRTMQQLELFVKSVRGEESTFIGQAQRQRKLDKSKDQIAGIGTDVCRHTVNLRTMLLLINTLLTHIAPCRADRELSTKLEKLQNMLEKLQRSLEANPQSRPSHTEATLMQCAHEVIVKGTTLYEANLNTKSVAGGQAAANGNISVADWVGTLESIRRDQRRSHPSDMIPNVPSSFPADEANTVVTSAASAQLAAKEREAIDTVIGDCDDDLYTDLAKAALDTGTKAFEAQEWEEADSLLQEALRVLQQLPKQQRAFCDIFSLQYRLAVCAYHIQEPADAEEALMSLAQQLASSDEQRAYIYDATHLLSYLHIRMGQIDRARSECGEALLGRRRLLGKRSDASLESIALMAHIYVLLNNPSRAKAYHAMIPETRIDTVVERIQSRLSASSLAMPTETRHSPVSTMISPIVAASPRQLHQYIPPKAGLGDRHSIAATSLWSAEERSDSRATEKEKATEYYSKDTEVFGAATLTPGGSQKANEIPNGQTLSRKDILDKIGCQPRDRLEESVCDGDHSAFASLLSKRKDFWRSKLRKHVCSERVTALHFAALFGEIDMARLLISSKFSINDVPYGYTTSLTPLNFAIGARQVDMVEFLITNGARPSEPDSWSSLAAQLMNRSWLMKTLSEAKKDQVPDQIIAILKILLKHGWGVNAPFDTSGGTLLHQAVTFWTGSYTWDLYLRTAVTSFLCEQGANPFQKNTAGKTPYDTALSSGHQDLLLILDRGSKNKELGYRPVEAVELST